MAFKDPATNSIKPAVVHAKKVPVRKVRRQHSHIKLSNKHLHTITINDPQAAATPAGRTRRSTGSAPLLGSASAVSITRTGLSANLPRMRKGHRPALSRALSELSTVLSAAAPDDLDSVVATAQAQPGLDESLWGPEPTLAEAAHATLANLNEKFAQRRELEAQSISRDQAAELLQVSPQAITGLLDTHRLVGLKRGRQWRIPAWQFDPESEQGTVPGIAELATAFPGGPVALSAWVTRASADLDGATPRDLLARGAVARVIALARTLTAAGW